MESSGSSLGRRAVAVLVLVVVAAIALKLLIGFLAGIVAFVFWIVVIVALVAAFLWARRTLRSPRKVKERPAGRDVAARARRGPRRRRDAPHHRAAARAGPRLAPGTRAAPADRISGMEPTTRVCPICGEPPGDGVFCAACGRNLTAVDRLPTRAEWEAAGEAGADVGAVDAAGGGGAGAGDAAAEAPPDAAELAARCSQAVVDVLAAAAAADDPRTKGFPTGKPGVFRRAPELRGWIVRPVDREDFEEPNRYTPGLMLAADGTLHQLDSELRGWGQRDFPRYEHTVSPEPTDEPPSARLLAELEALRASLR